MCRCLLLLLGLAALCQQGWTQRYDSLLNAVRTSKVDTLTIQLYHQLAEKTVPENVGIALAYEDTALLIAKKIKSSKQISITLTNIGSIYRNKSEFAKACSYYNEAVNASSHFSPWLGDTYLEAGISLLRMTELDSAMEILQQGVSLVKEHPNSAVEAALYNAMGNVKREQNQYEAASALYFQSLKLFEEQKDLKGQTQALSNISNIHNLIGDTDKALTYAMQSLETAKAAGVKSSVAYSYRLLGRIYRNQQKPDEALKAFEEAIQIYQGLPARREMGETELSIGNIHYDKKDFPEAVEHYKRCLSVAKAISDTLMMATAHLNTANALLLTKDYKNAEAYIDTSIVMAEKKNLVNIQMDSYALRSEIYEAAGNYKLSLFNYRTYIHIRDSLEREQHRLEAREIEARFQNEKKDDAIRLLNAENTLKASQQKYLLIILALLLVSAIILYSRYKVKLKANEKLKELDLVKSRFFSNISHEFRTPLSLILGPIEKRLPKVGDGEEKEGLKLMHRNARRLHNLINQLLDLSRIESGSMELHLEESDLAQTLHFIGSSFSSVAERKGIFYTQDILNTFMGCYDRDKVEKMINNLLSNAFKFTPEGGLVNFKAEVLNGLLTVEVKDSGIGIPKDQQENIFNRFYQIDDSTTRSSEGSGIGLALTKELAELHCGKLSVSSSEGIGSVFTVIIPVTREAFDGIPVKSPLIIQDKHYPSDDLVLPVQAINENESKALVLIAEDNQDMQKFIVQLLQDQYRTISALSGIEAYDRALAVVPDLVISDWMMPGMDGRTLCEKIKTTVATSHIPVLMLTARADQSSKLEGLETGADDYLIKPFDTNELVVRIHNLIEQRKKLRQLFSRELTLYPKQITLPSRDAEFLLRLSSLVEEKYTDPAFSVEELSLEIGMSRMQLHRKIKALTDRSPGEYLRIFRLERAKQMLANTGLQVSEVCFKVGYNNLSNFSKIFREYAGVTPTEFIAAAEKK
jgi:signal transduction histidine kinase/DNA-binding response OmpR family regulator